MTGTELAVGTRVGHYHITGRLGRGGMGVVYAGADTRLQRPVAIKLLAEHAGHEPEVLKRFLLEARAAASLNHPNVVTIHDVGHCDGLYYMVMELVGGGSAQARLDTHGALPWPEATRIIADVCRGLGAAHAAGLIHRDVKPGNILLSADGTAKLADFGLTKAPALMPGGLTQEGALIGTPHYMSPEHCTGAKLDGRADLYSLGTTYYELLVGQPPFDGPNPTHILFAHCSTAPPDPRDALPALPALCAGIIARAMAKERSERYASAEEMLHELLAASTSVPVAQPAAPIAATALAPTMRMPSPKLFPANGQSVRRRRRNVILACTAAGLSIVVVSALWLLVSSMLAARPALPPAAAEKKAPAPPPEKRANPARMLVALHARAAPLVGHQGEVKAVSIAGGKLASAGADSMVRLWDLNTGKLLHAMTHNAPLEAVALSPDGKLVAAGGQFKNVSVWEADTGKALSSLILGPSNISALAFAPAGKELAVGTETELHLVDVEADGKMSRRRRLLGQVYVVPSVAYSRDGKKLAACNGDGVLYVWDLASRKHQTAPDKFAGRPTAVALADDGSRVALGTHHGTVHLWEPERGPPALWSEQEKRITSLAFAPRCQTLLFAGEWGGPLRLCDLATKKIRHVRTGCPGVVNGLCFSPDGLTLAAACSDGTVRLWDVLYQDSQP